VARFCALCKTSAALSRQVQLFVRDYLYAHSYKPILLFLAALYFFRLFILHVIEAGFYLLLVAISH